MYVLNVRNVHQALPLAMDFLMTEGRHVSAQESRNGPVRKSVWPVTTHYERPTERVLFWAERNANPFFHFMEGLWMLAGRKDVKWIRQFNKSFGQFSDNGRDFHAAYGHRWRHHFGGLDQLMAVGKILKKNPLDRRAVLQMWDPVADLGKDGLDFPCNTTVYFDATHGYLNMTVCCRSNDVVWGAYGANAVHMSMMQEIVASLCDLPVGHYWQISNNWHGYLNTIEKVIPLRQYAGKAAAEMDPYATGEVDTYPMNTTGLSWFQDLDVFMSDGPIVGFGDPFFRRVVTPIYHAWMAKEDDEYKTYEKAIEIMQQCAASDWRKACTEWLIRNRKG